MRLSKNKVYYLASPYSHSNAFMRELRAQAVLYVATELTKKGYNLVEPIGMSHEKSTKYDMKGDYDFWQTRDRQLVKLCDEVLVLTIKGWSTSKGVTDEVSYAKRLGKKVTFINPEDIFNEEIRNALHNEGSEEQVRSTVA